MIDEVLGVVGVGDGVDCVGSAVDNLRRSELAIEDRLDLDIVDDRRLGNDKLVDVVREEIILGGILPSN